MKKVALAKTLAGIPFEENDETGRDMVLGTLEAEYPDYAYQCDELNNGPAELNSGELVVDVWESDTIKYTRFVVARDGEVSFHEKP